MNKLTRKLKKILKINDDTVDWTLLFLSLKYGIVFYTLNLGKRVLFIYKRILRLTNIFYKHMMRGKIYSHSVNYFNLIID